MTRRYAAASGRARGKSHPAVGARVYAFNHPVCQVFHDDFFQRFTKTGDLLKKAGAGVSIRWTISPNGQTTCPFYHRARDSGPAASGLPWEKAPGQPDGANPEPCKWPPRSICGIGPPDLEQTEKSHGRLETRRCWVTGDAAGLACRGQWNGLTSIALCERETLDPVTGKVTTGRRFFVTSLNLLPKASPAGSSLKRMRLATAIKLDQLAKIIAPQPDPIRVGNGGRTGVCRVL